MVELASPSDELEVLRRKMVAYMTNGASLGWLLLPQKRTVEVWTAAETANDPLVLNDPSRLEAGLEFPGLVMIHAGSGRFEGGAPGQGASIFLTTHAISASPSSSGLWAIKARKARNRTRFVGEGSSWTRAESSAA